MDRDGVLIHDTDLLTDPDQVKLLPGVAGAVHRAQCQGLLVIGVTNQPVVARGLCDEARVREINGRVDALLQAAGCRALTAWYFCPHHPQAAVEAYRRSCSCRKPSPGLLLAAARDLQLDLSVSLMVGDRLSDVAAGQRAGCRAVLVRTGRHQAPPIVVPGWDPGAVVPDHICDDLRAAVDWMLEQRPAIRALVLCAGRGTRMGELTRMLPKPLLPLGGRPLLAYTLCYLARHGIDQVAINLHFEGARIREQIRDGSGLGVKVHYVEEPVLLGTAGAVANLGEFFAGADHALVIHGDLLVNQDLRGLVDSHLRHDASATLLVHRRAGSNSALELDAEGRILAFLERPSAEERARANIRQPWVNSGLQLLRRSLIARIPPKRPADLPRDLYVPLLAEERFYGFPLTGRRIAIDTPDRYAEAGQAVADGDYPPPPVTGP